MSRGRVTLIGAQGATLDRDLSAFLTPTTRDQIRGDANRWIKSLRLVSYDSRNMRERFRYQGDSLWWFTEIYLHKMRRLEQAIGTVLALDAACDEHAPHRLLVESDDDAVRKAVVAFGHTRGLAVELRGRVAPASRHQRIAGFLVAPSAFLSRLRSRALLPPARAPRVAAFVHTAFWRDRDAGSSSGRESYIGAVLDALSSRLDADQLTYAGVGPQRTFRLRRWWDPLFRQPTGPRALPIERLAPAADLKASLELWRQREELAADIVRGASIREAGRWGKYDLWPVLSDALRQVARVQWPWSARSMDEARAALRRLRPASVVTYAEAGGWGRALMLEARRAEIPSVGLQHGFIYPHWLNYEHHADEMQAGDGERGFPRPDKTLLFDRYARQTLETRGHFPPESLIVTGSPRLDELARQVVRTGAERTALRTSLGVGPDDKLLVVAAKFSEIEEELPSVVAAVRGRSDLRVIVKPHPAETADVYRQVVGASANISIAEHTADLGRLLSGADAILTKNSTVGIDGLALGVPTLVVGQATNLTEFVRAGAMVAAQGEGIRAGLETLLYDREARARLLARAAEFAAEFHMRSDGQAADRAAAEILALSPSETRSHDQG